MNQQLTSEELEKLEPYRRALPKHEFEALYAWLTTFWSFQRAWILDDSRFAACNKARQIGISHSTAGLLVLWAVFHGETSTVISIGDREAREVLDKVKKHLSVLERLGSDMAKKVRDSAEEVRVASGGRVIALPSSGGRSFSGNVYLDEFAYYQHPDKVWDAAMAVTMLGYRGRVSSTPNGVGNQFYDLINDPDAGRGWSKHEIQMSAAIACGYPVDEKACWTMAKGDPRLYDQLFNCKFLDGELQYIPSDLVFDCSADSVKFDREGKCFAGLDVGKEADKTVLVVLQKQEKRLAVVYIETRSRTDSDALDEMVARAFDQFSLRRLCVDSTGLGSFPAERMRKKHGIRRVEPVVFTLKSKEDMATALFTAFADRVFLLPRKTSSLPEKPNQILPGNTPGSAEQLRHDVCSLQRIVTTAGNIRYDAPRTDKGHADSAWSLALALRAAGQEQARGNLSPDLAAVL